MKANLSILNFFAFVECSSFYFDLGSMFGARPPQSGSLLDRSGVRGSLRGADSYTLRHWTTSKYRDGEGGNMNELFRKFAR